MENLLLLHGAIGTAEQLKPLAEALSANYKVHTLDFSGHAGKPLGHGGFSIELFANDVLSYIEYKGLGKVAVFGYSMGGYVAMYLARHYPARIGKVVTLATKFQWDEAIAAAEMKMLIPEKIEEKLPAFAETLRTRHLPADWKVVLRKTAEMMEHMGADNPMRIADYTHIQAPVLVLLGDRDKMVSLVETVNVFKALPVAQLGILPATPHPIEQVDLAALVPVLTRFLG
jgi:pimeloyl-ACP methyl ester carboxylesterase